MDVRAQLRAGLTALRLPYTDSDLDRLTADYAEYRIQADELLAVDLPLVGSEPASARSPRETGIGRQVWDPVRPPGPEHTIPGTLAAAATALRAGTATSMELLEAALVRADLLDGSLGTYIARFDDSARAAAAAADESFAKDHDLGPLQGIPIGIKDNLNTADGPMTAQSDAMPVVSASDAEVVRRLRAGGAVIVGKLSLMEFGTGLPDPVQRFPTPRNPWDLLRWSGGSSSGSANGVSGGLFLGALGTDTGGSNRNPAAFCGVTGFKPTHGAVPLAGMVPLAPSMDCIGPIARTATDCALLLSVLAPELRPGRGQMFSLEGLTVGVDRAGMVDVSGSEPGVVEAFDAAMDVLCSAGATLVDVRVPHLSVLRFIMRLLIDSERLAAHLGNLHERWSDYSPTFRDKVRRGVFGSATELATAHRVRAHVTDRLELLFGMVDVVASPTSHYTAPPVAGLQSANRPELQMTPAWSVSGHPAVSVPMGFAADGAPIGLQLATGLHRDHDLLDIAAAFQARTAWHLQTPGLVPEARYAQVEQCS